MWSSVVENGKEGLTVGVGEWNIRPHSTLDYLSYWTRIEDGRKETETEEVEELQLGRLPRLNDQVLSGSGTQFRPSSSYIGLTDTVEKKTDNFYKDLSHLEVGSLIFFLLDSLKYNSPFESVALLILDMFTSPFFCSLPPRVSTVLLVQIGQTSFWSSVSIPLSTKLRIQSLVHYRIQTLNSESSVL